MIGPITSMSMAGKINVATGSIIFTGAFATLSSSLPFLIARASTASKLRFSAIEVPNRMDLITFSANLSKSKESYDRAIWRNPSLRSMRLWAHCLCAEPATSLREPQTSRSKGARLCQTTCHYSGQALSLRSSEKTAAQQIRHGNEPLL